MHLAPSLLAWYQQNARDLPWRKDPSPYKTWISEIMLQQTQVDTVLPYFIRFMRRFPDIKSLAESSESDLLKAWEGLGYYSRARNLHKAAKLINEPMGGELPATAAALQALPGIGRYTAGAIASIAFSEAEPALDGNIRRVYARVLADEAPLGSPASDKRLWAFAREQMPADRPGDFNQALMELGALICRPKQPLCQDCPLAWACQSFKQGKQAEIPVKKPKPAIPEITVTAAVIRNGSHVLIQRRPPEGLLGGLWEFPGGKLEPTDQGLQDCLRREIMEEIGVNVEVGEGFGHYKHAFTHFKISLYAFFCSLMPGETMPERETLRWVLPSELDAFAMGKVDRQIANRLQKL